METWDNEHNRFSETWQIVQACGEDKWFLKLFFFFVRSLFSTLLCKFQVLYYPKPNISTVHILSISIWHCMLAPFFLHVKGYIYLFYIYKGCKNTRFCFTGCMLEGLQRWCPVLICNTGIGVSSLKCKSAKQVGIVHHAVILQHHHLLAERQSLKPLVKHDLLQFSI